MTEPIDDRQYVDTRSESPPDRLLQEERGARVRAAIAELPRKQRATLILRMYHEMSHQEIADVLGSSVGAVKTNFFHALGNLKKQLGGEHFEKPISRSAMHLTPDELIDLAEGTRAEATRRRTCSRATSAGISSPRCGPRCRPRPQGRGARAVAAVLGPSCQQRVREAVAAEGSPRSRLALGMGVARRRGARGRWPAWRRRCMIVDLRHRAPDVERRRIRAGRAGCGGGGSSLQPFGAADDPSLALVADLTEQMDSGRDDRNRMDAAMRVRVDEVVANLTDDERLELQRLLNEELAKS